MKIDLTQFESLNICFYLFLSSSFFNSNLTNIYTHISYHLVRKAFAYLWSIEHALLKTESRSSTLSKYFASILISNKLPSIFRFCENFIPLTVPTTVCSSSFEVQLIKFFMDLGNFFSFEAYSFKSFINWFYVKRVSLNSQQTFIWSLKSIF